MRCEFSLSVGKLSLSDHYSKWQARTDLKTKKQGKEIKFSHRFPRSALQCQGWHFHLLGKERDFRGHTNDRFIWNHYSRVKLTHSVRCLWIIQNNYTDFSCFTIKILFSSIGSPFKWVFGEKGRKCKYEYGFIQNLPTKVKRSMCGRTQQILPRLSLIFPHSLTAKNIYM